ncbi:hypothetical protein [Mariprofundus ferrooxydans]|uniref:hypothetical protein n=1 Tax=Mariprofundus ferrooxydans TaxID=314344 RepID=UPI00142F6491|nr:hypothetical protein [Mariprofundus ferrooxydans]
MSLSEVLIFVGVLSVPVAMMLAHDYRVAGEHGLSIFRLPACFNRYCTLIALTSTYGGIFYVLLFLFTNGYLDNGQSLNLYDKHDFFMPTVCISTITMLLFGYILQADNAFYLSSLMHESAPASVKRDLILRTFRAISIGKIAPGILFPLSIPLWALHGAWLYNIYNIVMRASNQDLMPRVFFFGAVRMIMALFVSVLVYCVVQAFLKPYRTGDDGETLVVQNSKAAYILVAIAFFAGLFPMQAAQATWQRVKSSGFMGELFSPSTTLSIEYLQGMNAFMRDRLFEEGIVDVHQLATIGNRRDLLYSRIENLISKEQLSDWIDQAQLMLFISDRDLLQALRSAGIRGKQQLDELLRPENSERLQQLEVSLTGEKDAKVKRFLEQYNLTHAPVAAPQ